jgi:hypothetical protein
MLINIYHRTKLSRAFAKIGFTLLFASQLAVQLRFWNLNQFGHERLELTERGIWRGLRGGGHPTLLYLDSLNPQPKSDQQTYG